MTHPLDIASDAPFAQTERGGNRPFAQALPKLQSQNISYPAHVQSSCRHQATPSFLKAQLSSICRPDLPAITRNTHSDANLKLMHRIDKPHMEFPFAGARMLRDLLAQEGVEAGRLHVATLMKRMGVEALYRKPRCLIPGFDGAISSSEWKDALWARYCTEAPRRRGSSG
jgi:hypothetical protein